MKKKFICFILLDVFMAMLIAGIALLVFIGNVSLGMRNTALARQRMEILIMEKNRYEKEREVLFETE
jgi:Tfp pilus assembly protein PilV